MDSDSPHPLFRFRFLFLAGYFALWVVIAYAACSSDWLLEGRLEFVEFAIVAAVVVGLQIVSLLWVLGPGVVLLFFARRIQRRERFGYCRNCGYDLRMLPTNRCPECGTPFDLTAPRQAAES
jgi:hypothetical protein